MKKTIAIILSIIMLLGCLGTVGAGAASSTVNIKAGGHTYTFYKGTIVTYTVYLKAPELIENGQFLVTYPQNLLSVRKVNLPNVDGYMVNYNQNVKDQIKFNFSNYNGFDFTEKKVLAKIEFDVIGSGSGDFNLKKQVIANLNDVNIVNDCTISETFDNKISNPSLSAKSKKLKAGKAFTLKVKGTSEAVTFSSNKKSVASVSKKGVVTALKKGTAKITAKLKSGKKLTCKVSVTSNPKLSPTKIKVKLNGTKKVKISGKAKSVNNKYSKTKIAKVISKTSASTIKVKGLKKGTTTLKITVNKKVLKLKVTVTK